MSSSTPAMPAQSMSMGAVLRESTVMRRLWYAQIISVFGDFLALFAVISVLTFKLRVTAEQITGVQIAYLLPIAILCVFAGVFVDRWPLKPTLIASDLLRAGLVLLLFVTTSTWQIYLVLCALSCVSSFFGPAQSVTIRSHVPSHGLMSANALMSMAMMGTRVIGPAVAGALVAAFGPRICYAIDFVSFLASAALISSVAIVRAMSPPRAAVESTNSKVHAVFHEMAEGMRFIVHHAAISFVVMAMAAGMFVIGCFGPLIAIYVRDWLHANAGTFGFVSAMVGVGMMIGMPAVRRLSGSVASTTLVLGGLAGIGLGALLLGAFTFIPTAMLGCFTIGFTFAGVIVPAQTLMQRETPPALIGRISSTMMSAVFFAQVAGLFLSGFLAHAFGVRAVFILCAVMAWVLTGAGKLLLGTERHAAAL